MAERLELLVEEALAGQAERTTEARLGWWERQIVGIVHDAVAVGEGEKGVHVEDGLTEGMASV